MNKLYKSVEKKSNLFSKLLFLILVSCIGVIGTLKAQNVEVSYTLPAAGTTNYLTLKAAFDKINDGTHKGVITIVLKTGTTESATAILNSSTLPASYSSIAITPFVAGIVVTGSLGSTIIKLNGADNVTIDGLIGGVQGLTFRNTSMANTSGVVWVASSSSSNGATNNIIKDCIITGGGATNTLVGLAQCSGTTLGGLAETSNSNNTYRNNIVSGAQFGIGVVGASGSEDDNTQILSNTVTTLGRAAVFVSTQKNVLVSGNTLSGVNSNLGNFTIQNSGILVVGSIIAGRIDKNTISNIKIASVWGCNGIQLDASNPNTGLVISNNFIFDITAGGYPFFDTVDDNGTGIAVNSGGGYNIEYNSIDLSTNQPAAGITAAIWFSSAMGASSVTLKNNIFSNRETTSSRYAIYTNTTSNSLFIAINNNDYYSPTGSVGFLSAARANLANWQAVSGGDGASVSVNPIFISATNLHLQTNSPLDGLAVPIAGITTDIDGDSRNVTTPDIGADEFIPLPCAGSLGGTASASVTSICASGSSILSATGYSYGLGISYQWQSSATGVVGTFSNIAGQTNPLIGLTGVIGVTTYYHLLVSCSFTGTSGTSNVIQITVNNPAVSGASAVTRCGVGTTTATATGTNLQWYTASSGGLPFGTGSPVTTPVLSSTTTLYVSASSAGVNCAAGKASTTGADLGYNGTDAGLVFDATVAFKIVSVKMYPQAAGTVTVSALTSAGAVIASTPVNFAGATSTGVVVPLGFNIPIGTAHRLIISSNPGFMSIWRDFSPLAFPYPICTVGAINTGWLGGNTTAYYFFYDWQVSTSCESLRVPVTATVTPPPALTSLLPAAGPARSICQGDCVTLSAGGGGYTSYGWNPGNLPNPTTVCPTVTTTYTLTADIPGGCRRQDFVTITVNTTPTAVSVTPVAVATCPNSPVTITASQGLIPGQTIHQELGEPSPPLSYTLTNNGGGSSNVNLGSNTTYFQQGTRSIHLTHGNYSNGALESGNIPMTAFSAPKLTFYHIAGLEATSTNHYDVGYVEYSLAAVPTEASWVKFPASAYLGSGSLIGGVTGFDNTSYPDWDAQFSSAGSTPGVAPATSLWKLETINLAVGAGQANFRIRFHLVTDVSIIYYGWLIDNINIVGTGQAPITWTPVTNLYFQLPAIPANAYVGGTNYPTVYYNTTAPAAAVTYTATATNGSCTSTATSTISSGALGTPTVSITQTPSGPICSGTCVTFNTVIVNAGATPAFEWFLNGASQGPSTVGNNTFTKCTLANGDQIQCKMVVNITGSCATSFTVFSNIITMTVNPTPTATPITGGNTVCNSSVTVLTETPVGSVTNYEWFLDSGSGPVTIQNGAPSTYNATLPGTYSVIVNTAFNCPATSAPLIVTLPTYTITASAGPNGTISPIGTVVVNCGDDQTFTITPNAGFNILDVLVDGVSNPAAILAGSYTFTNVTANGHTINVTFVNPSCATPATSNAGTNSSICYGTNYTITGASIGGPGVTGGTWTSSNGGLGTFNPSAVFGTATSFTPSTADSANGSVNLTLTTNDPVGLCPASSSTINIIIKPNPYVVIGGQIGLCTIGATQTTLLADVSATQVAATGFQWYHPFPGTTVGIDDPSYQTAVGATGSYTVVVSGANGCSGSNTVVVNILPTPTISISGVGPICTDAGIDINATALTSTGTIVPNGYAWYNPTLIPSATVSILTANSAGSYTATATNSYGCISAPSSAVVLAADNSPLNGLYTIGAGPATCTNYVSFAKAINDLNTRGISGNCQFSVPAGYTETVPLNGLKLGSGTLNPQTVTRTITFSKSGAGANPLLTAYPLGGGSFATASPDGIFCLRGVDNVAINQIDLTEDPANTTTGKQMEYGYGIFKFSAGDGAQNNTIQNCTIALNRSNAASGTAPNPDGSNGIVIINAVDNAALTPLVPTSSAGTNSDNKIYGNTITNVHNGITFVGYNAPSPFTLADTNNDIGGTTASTGNTITNFGNSGDVNPAIGIRISHQWGVNASFNTINNNDGLGSNTTNDLKGIMTTGGSGANATFSSNTISLTSNTTGSAAVGIENGLGGSGVGNTVSIFNNDISGTSLLGGSTATWYGINNINTGSAATLSIANNKIHDIIHGGNGIFTGILNSASASNLFVNNNTIIDNIKTSPAVSNSNAMILINTGSPTNAIISNNILINNALTGGGFNSGYTCVLGATSNYSVDHNTMENNSIVGMSGSSVGTLIGYNNQAGPPEETISDNIIRNLFITGTSTGVQIVRGISNATISGQLFRKVTGNVIDSLYTSAAMSAAIAGINSAAGNNVSISKNQISKLWPGQSVTAGSFAKGIAINTAGTTINVTVSNNSIAIDLLQGPNNGLLKAATAVAGIEVSSTAIYSLYYNTIRLAGSGAAGFGSSGIGQSNGTLDMRNNIVTNYMTPGAGGFATAYRRTGGTHAATSNNNLWYTLQDAAHPIYYTTVGVNTLALFQAAVTPRESLSIGDNPVFVSTATNNLHLDPANNCNLDGGGTPIPNYTDDLDGDVRDLVLPDIGMDEFTGSGSGFVWKGKNTDWLNANNWCGGIPTAASDVLIPTGKAFYPIIVTATTALAHNITVNGGGNIMINDGGTLANTGSWTNNGILTNNGNIVLNGNVNQVFPGTGTGTLPAMDSLTVINAGGATINKPITLTGTLKPKQGNIAVNDVITLHSDLTGTARVDTVQGSISYGAVGKFVVERYISSKVAGVARTAWRFLSAPIGGTQTINAAWQNGEIFPAYTPNGYGMQIVGPGTTVAGFDMNNTLSSLKKYDGPTNTWVSVTGTYGPISTADGYMTFIRGDRGSNVFGSSSSTTLRMTGPIKTGPITVSNLPANVNQFISVGNPYPSAISFASASTVKTGILNTYYIWDPKLGVYGGFQSFSLGTGYVPVPGGGSYAGGNNAIESGEAFFVVANGSVAPHSIQMVENSKVGSNVQVARLNDISKFLNTRLYLVTDSTRELYDGNRVNFDPAYSNLIDEEDAPKMGNFGESLGLLRDGKSIVLECRAEVVSTDTIFYNLGSMRQKHYQLEFGPENFTSPVLAAYLEDAYLNTRTDISLEAATTVDFEVNGDVASKAANRFRLVFRQLGPVPVTFTSIRANRQDKDIMVTWKIENEMNIANYEVERSSDGHNFGKIGSQLARNIAGSSTQQYSLLDINPLVGDNFYRIRSVGNSADVKYSEIVKVNMKGDPSMITVYPNPVKEDGIVRISLANEPAGTYRLQLINAAGQTVLSRIIIHEGGNSVYSVGLNKAVAHGNYIIQITEGNKVKTTLKILY